MKIPRKTEVIIFEREGIIEWRSTPLWAYLLEHWFLYAHEWLYMVGLKRIHNYLMGPFCYAWSMMANWLYKFETIDRSLATLRKCSCEIPEWWYETLDVEFPHDQLCAFSPNRKKLNEH